MGKFYLSNFFRGLKYKLLLCVSSDIYAIIMQEVTPALYICSFFTDNVKEMLLLHSIHCNVHKPLKNMAVVSHLIQCNNIKYNLIHKIKVLR